MFNNYTPTYVPNLGNGQGFGGNQSFGGFTQPAPAPAQNQIRSNKIYVMDANDALTRQAMPDTIVLYVQQDESAIHEVYTDTQGRKLIRTRTLVDVQPTAAQTGMVTRKEFEDLKAAVEKMKGGTISDDEQ